MTVSQYVYNILNFAMALLLIGLYLFLLWGCVTCFMMGWVGFGWFYVIVSLLVLWAVVASYREGQDQWKKSQLPQNQN